MEPRSNERVPAGKGKARGDGIVPSLSENKHTHSDKDMVKNGERARKQPLSMAVFPRNGKGKGK